MHPGKATVEAGVTLITVMIVLLICCAVVAVSARTGLLHEMLTGNQSDQMRANTAAEALIRDAEIDIRGILPNGLPCRASPGTTWEIPAGIVGCRERGTNLQATAPYFPQNTDEFEEVRQLVGVDPSRPCVAAICFPPNVQLLEHLENEMPSMLKSAASYGQFTRTGQPGPGSAGNTILTGPTPKAWYWVEAFRYDLGSDTLTGRGGLSPDPTRPFVYRITAVALGLKPETRSVIKSFFVPYPIGQLQ